MMDIALVVTIIACLFLVIGMSEPLAARVGLPYTVVLALVGILIGVGAGYFRATDLTDALNPVAEAILNFPIRSNVFLFVFLPTLLFQVTLGLNLRRMLDDWVPILILAVVAVVVATLTIGYALSVASTLPLAACLLIGSIVSTTDPSAVVSIFRNIAAPQRLTRIIEGESLLNDAAAIALFGLFMGLVMVGVPDPTLESALARFPVMMLNGALIGWFTARLAVGLMAWLPRHPLGQVSVSVALPYLAYVLAEMAAGASGVIAVVAAGMTANLIGPGRLSPGSWAYMREVWAILAHWAGAFIFVLAALLIPRFLGDMHWGDLGLIVVVIVAAMAARAVILFGLMPALTALRVSPPVDPPYRAAILWGGLRGAVTLALALAVTESFRVAPETKRLVGILATGFTLFTLLAQGTTLRWVIGRLGVDRLSPLDTALANQVIAVALQSVREDVAETTASYGLSRETVRTEALKFGERLQASVEMAEEGAEILDRDRITLGLIALAGRERYLIIERFREGDLSAPIAERMLSDADRLIEAARSGGRTGYLRAGRRAVRRGAGLRLAVWMHNRLRLSASLARRTADTFEALLTLQLILSDLTTFINGRIRRIHGRRVADLLHDLLARRIEEVGQLLDGMRLQFPGYAEDLERRFIRLTALRYEDLEYTVLREEGLIGPELHTKLTGEIDSARRALERRPRLDLALHKADLVDRLPLFAGLDARGRRALLRALRTVYAAPGDVLFRRDSVAERVYFIASGAVEMELGPQVQRFGRGEMFGQLALLMRTRRRGQVRAITHCILLSLDGVRFRRLLRRSPEIRAAVQASADARGVTLEGLEGA